MATVEDADSEVTMVSSADETEVTIGSSADETGKELSVVADVVDSGTLSVVNDVVGNGVVGGIGGPSAGYLQT